MSSTHRFAIDLDDLGVDFDTATIARGLRYADEGRVRDVFWEPDGCTLTGACAGSRGYVYGVDVSFTADEEGVIEWTACECPVGNFCKHAVALLLAAVTAEPPPPDPDRWRTVLAGVLDEIAAPPADAGAPIGLEFSLTSAGPYLPDGTISLRPVTIGKRGTWIKSGLSWQQLSYQTQPGQFNRRQYLAVRDLAAALQRSGLMLYGQTVLLSGVSSALWPQLAAVQDAGVALVAGKSSGLRAIELIKNAQLRLDFTAQRADPTGGAVMAATLLIDGEQTDPRGVTLIGRPEPHGLYRVADGLLRLGAFDPVPGPALVDLLAHDGVYIPAEGVDEVALSLLPRLAHAAPVQIEEGLFAPPVITGPHPVLTVTMTGAGARAYWSTRYDINGRHHDFDPAAAPRPAGFRDITAEEAAWQRIAPALRAVAAAGGPAAAGAAMPIAALRRTIALTTLQLAVLCAEILPGLDCRDGLVIEIDETAPDFHRPRTDPQLVFDSGETEPVHTDWFDLNITVRVDEHSVALPDVIVELAAGATHMLLPGGVYFRLDTPELTRLKELLDEARALGEIDAGLVNAGSLNVTLWDELLELGVVDEQVAAWRENLARLSAARPPAPVDVPDGLDATLRDYQRDGLDWLAFLWDNGLGGVLADDMGLGKTVQTLALISRAADAGAGKFLVVAPTSVVGNWITEAARFTPDLSAVAVRATEARSGGALAELVAGADIVVTSYALLRIDFDAYARINWAGAIFDEAQFVKNRNSKTHQCARRLDAGFKLAITGTPMENNLMELWSLLSITVPGLFASPKAFGDYFRKPIESGANTERLPVLRRRIKPVMLRRTKTQVVAELPEKQEQLLSVELGVKHRKIYDTRLARERQKVLGLLGDWEKNRFQIFRSLTVLRQLSLHPGLVDATDIAGGSAKIDFLVEQLPQLVAEGHSALVFSQFTGFLAILRSHLDAAGLDYSYLDGSVNARGRQTALARFAAGATQVFLISLKAGGFGLNLTEADYCFLCDPWWSPAAEAQAVDRTHRIGQTRPVTVYRLVSAGTIEEKVIALQQRKRELFTAVLDDGALFGSAITASDVAELLG